MTHSTLIEVVFLPVVKIRNCTYLSLEHFKNEYEKVDFFN